MIVYILKDGLGNQLFEYSFARKLQEITNDKSIRFCTFLYRFPNFSLSGTRQCSLKNFKLSSDTKILSGLPNFFFFVLFILRMVRVHKIDFFKRFILHKTVTRNSKYEFDCKKGLYICEGAFASKNVVSCKKRIKFIFGNFEGIDALPQNMERLKEEFSITIPLSDNNKKILENIVSTESVCLHIRRGDYLNKTNAWLQVCDYHYYTKAIEYVKRHVKNPVFYVFSNTHEDIQWIKNNYEFVADLVYVDLSNSDCEELRLMYSCKQFIISNSTFSWWASVLSSNSNKIVIAPSKWTNDSSDYSGMYPAYFHKLQ